MVLIIPPDTLCAHTHTHTHLVSYYQHDWKGIRKRGKPKTIYMVSNVQADADKEEDARKIAHSSCGVQLAIKLDFLTWNGSQSITLLTTTALHVLV